MTDEPKKTGLDRAVFTAFPDFSWEKLILSVIIILAILSRFIGIGARVMSHDEVNHVVPAYNFYTGKGYSHDPVTHGPFQFHMLALSYFLFGDGDYSSRIPAAFFSVAAIIFTLFAFRRYLGRNGTLIAGFLMLISPFLLFYGRYTRNEAFIELFAVVTFYGFLRYYEKRDDRSLYLLAAVTALQFVTKEVAYIYTAQLLLFCGFLFLKDLWEMKWESRSARSTGAIYLLLSFLLIALGLCFSVTAAPAAQGEKTALPLPTLILCGIGLLGIIWTIIYVVRALGWEVIRTSAAFNLIAFLGALILPQLTAFAVKMAGFDPLDYSTSGLIRTGIFLIVFLAISFALGCRWNREVFLRAAVIFYIIFVFFYTTVFSNGMGFFTGIIGSLGYWLSQQDVQRGGQPLYYYALTQVPVYEFAALAGTIIAIIIGFRHRKFRGKPGDLLSEDDDVILITEDENGEEIVREDHTGKIPTLLFFLYWGLTALLAYSVAGEKMPWLTVHIALPLAMSAAWGLGYMTEVFPWKKLTSWKGASVLAFLVTGLIALIRLIGMLLGTNPPFAGKELEQLKATGSFTLYLLILVLCVYLLARLLKGWSGHDIKYSVILLIMALLCILQGRTAYTSSFINYDYANELMVYAHAAPGPKIVLNMIEEIAARTGEGKNIKVAYDNDSLYPYWWYFRDYPNKYYFGEGNPTRELRNYDAIILNTSKDGRMEQIVKDNYYRYEYVRLWWPNQDYFNLTASRIWKSITNPEMLSALFHIWLDRDYSKYAEVTGKASLTPQTWEPRTDIAVYLRKDLMNKMFLLTDSALVMDEPLETEEDEDKFIELAPVSRIGRKGIGDGEFQGPRGVAVSPDNQRIYVLDSDNNRVQYFAADGTYEGQWNNAENGGMNQPWGIAVGSDGSVYVADTWNHRVLKFDADGKFLTMWYAMNDGPDAKSFYGPRSIAVSSAGKVYVSDTGNKRIMVYDENGTYLSQFGVSGMGMGELDEPVGITLLDDNRLAVADTWNQRIQIFDVTGSYPAVINAFEVNAWYSQNLNNKPYIAGLPDGTILITDPEGYTVNQYSADGTLLRMWNGFGGNIDAYSMPIGLCAAPDGSVWVADAENAVVSKFVLPE